ncbi:MAG: hypothetical protein ACQESA_02350 [Patescibacteria group bacterium]
MSQYEVEVKSLLDKKRSVKDLISQMEKNDPELRMTSQNSQLNHYFFGGDVYELFKKVNSYLTEEKKQELREIVEKGESFSVRTRKKDSSVYLVIKASVDEGTSENTISRLEFEKELELSLDEIDSLVLDSGYDYQAKWSRDRSEYVYKDCNVCIDRNAGYGYLVEFEKVIDEEEKISDVKSEIKRIMDELGLDELPQDRLERMFEYYNKNWHKYYGTNKIFSVK